MAKELTENQKRCIVVLQANGQSHGRIAAAINVHRNTVGRFCKKEKIEREFDSLFKEKTLWQKIKKVLGW